MISEIRFSDGDTGSNPVRGNNFNGASMETKDKELTELVSAAMRRKGLFSLVKEILKVAQEHSEQHRNNPEAVIHEDVKELQICVNSMASKNPLRFYDV